MHKLQFSFRLEDQILWPTSNLPLNLSTLYDVYITLNCC